MIKTSSTLKKSSVPEIVEVISLPHDQLLKALYWIWDCMERSSVTLLLVGSTAESVKNHRDLIGDKITVAVRKNEWDSGAKNIVDAFATPIVDNGTTLDYEFEGTPIKLFILEDNAMLTSADTILYKSEYFKMPNPLEQFVREFPEIK